MRVCLYSLDDSYPFIDEEKIYFLNCMKQCVDQLQIICNVVYEESELNKLKAISSEVQCGINGMDANRWQYAIQKLYSKGTLGNVDELVLVNDSFFGPLFPLNEVFETMSNRKVDFWGMSVHGRLPRAASLFQKKNYWERFLQTYFLCFRKTVLSDSRFIQFWKKVPFFSSHDEYEEKFEFALTDFFGKKFSWDVYANTTEWESDDVDKYISFILFQPYEMISKKHLPILSKYAVTIEKKMTLNFHLGEQISKSIDYIDNHTDYNINLIYSYLIKRNNLYDLKNSLHLNFVLFDSLEMNEDNFESGCYVDNYNDKIEIELQHRKIAIFAHLYYEDLFDYCLTYLKPLSRAIDIYITTDNEEKRYKLKSKLSADYPIKDIKVYNSRGREWGAFLLVDKQYMSNYEYICLIHDKKSAQMFFSTVGKSFCDNLWENTLKNPAYVYQIIKLFEQNKFIGVISPPEVYHGTYFNTSIDFWTICFDQTKELLSQMGIYVPLDETKPPVTIGSVFWCKCDAINKLICTHFQESDFPEEPLPVDGSFNHCLERMVPYIAQDKGYYTCNVMTPEYGRMNLTNYQEMLRQEMRFFKNNSGHNLSTFQSSLETDK